MKNGYQDDLTIDRIDVYGNYCPENCRWADRRTQQRNRQNTIRIIYNNEEYCLQDLCEKLEFPYKLAIQRYHKLKDSESKVDLEKLFAPPRRALKYQYKDKEYSAKEFSDITGIPHRHVRYKIEKGFSLEEIEKEWNKRNNKGV